MVMEDAYFMFCRVVRILVVLGVSLCAVGNLKAAISADQAAHVAVQWLARGKAPHGPAYRRAAHTQTFKTASGDAFHCVDFAGGGFAVVPAEADSAAVICYSADGSCQVDNPNNPLRGILTARRMAFAKAAFNRTNNLLTGLATLYADSTAPCATTKLTASSQTSVADIRVEPLMQTVWSQTTDAYGNFLYNYYTPDNTCCGCVATAVAQVMRYHKHPTSSISAFTKDCWLNDEEITLTAQGGAYDWDNMPFNPNYSATESQRAAIGKLCSDVGISVHAQYSANGTSAYLSFAYDPLTKIFGYNNAYGYCSTASDGSMTTEEIRRIILPDLDASYPVLLGIVTTANEGHAVVADGYGYSDDTLYVHINLGWGYSSYNVWYALPLVDTGPYTFTLVNSAVYNIFPSSTGDIISGRVVDAKGNPLASATVTLQKAVVTTSGRNYFSLGRPSGPSKPTTYTTNWTTIATPATNDKGIWSTCVKVTSSTTYRVTATKGSTTSTATQQGTLTPGGSLRVASWEKGSYYPSAMVLGNLSFGDLVVPLTETITQTQNTEVPVAYDWLAEYYPDADTTDYETLAAQTGANGRSVWESYLLGLDPTNETSDLKASITFVDGKPVIQWNVTSEVARAQGYVYEVVGKKEVTDAQWATTNDTHRFFQVRLTPED